MIDFGKKTIIINKSTGKYTTQYETIRTVEVNIMNIQIFSDSNNVIELYRKFLEDIALFCIEYNI